MNLPKQAVVFLDANIVMYAAGGEHAYREPSQKVLQAIARGDLIAVIDTEIVQEILYRYGSQRRFTEAVAVANDLLALVSSVYPVTLADISRAIALFQQYAPQGVQARDAIHAAVMLNNGITHIVSADRHFDLISGIQRVDPIALFSPSADS